MYCFVSSLFPVSFFYKGWEFFWSENLLEIFKKKRRLQTSSPRRSNYRTQGTETTQQKPTPERHAGDTRTANPTRREQRRANAAAEARDTNNDQTTNPEKDREEARNDQEKHPPDKAKPTTRRNPTRTRPEPKPTQKEERDTSKTPEKKNTTGLQGAAALNQGRA